MTELLAETLRTQLRYIPVEGYNGIKKRRGHPNWTKPHLCRVAQARSTEFELLLEKLGIAEAGCEKYPQVRQWILKHAKLRYIPEYLLKLCGTEVRWEDIKVY